MKSKFIFLFLIVFCCLSQAQAQDWTRSLSNRGVGRQVLALPNGDAMLLTDTSLLRISAFGERIWEKKYAANIVRFSRGVDNGFVLIGAQSSTKSGTRVIKIDDNGGVVWTKDLPQGTSWSNDYALCTVGTSGYVFSNQYLQKQHITMLSSNGSVVWDRTFDFVNVVVDKSIITDKDGNILAAGVRGVLKLSAAGDSLWYSKFTTSGKPFSVTQTFDNQYVVVGSSVNTQPGFAGGKLFISKLKSDGQTVWSSTIGATSDAGLSDVIATTDGGFTAAGKHNLGGLGLFHFDQNGKLIWKLFPNGIASNLSAAYSLTIDNKGKYLVAGTQWKVVGTQNIYDATLSKVSDISNQNFINGRVFLDKNNDCNYNTGDQNLSEWIIQLNDGTKRFFATSDKNGSFSANVPKGNYSINAVLPNEYFKACTPIGIASVLNNDTIVLNFAMQPQTIKCPQLRVNMTTPKLAACSESEYCVSYINDGTDAAANAYIIMDFDKAMTFKNSSILATKLSNTSYRFELSTLDIGQKGSFKVKTLLRCDSLQTQQVVSATAHIYPNTSCLAPPANWSGAKLDINARCDVDSVRFEVKNTGISPMGVPIQSIVEEDILMLQIKPIKLKVSEAIKFNFPRNGKTYRITMPQEANYPYPSNPTAFVEGCGTNPNGGISTGFVTMFPEDEAAKFRDIDCQELGKTFAVSEKESFPKGINTAHFVAKNTEIEYMIRFQNSFLDSTNTLVIYDTLSTLLNPATLEMGTSSHPYSWELLSNGILKCTFLNINLAPSSINASGFLQFRIAQTNNNIKGSKIYNSVAIYQNNHAPQLSNQTFLTVGENYVDILPNTEVFDNQYIIKISPNPFNEVVRFEIVHDVPDHYTLSIMNVSGQIISQQQYDSNIWTLSRNELSNGFYLYSIRNGQGKLIQSGKLIAR
jgi:hypothetical protein